MVIFLNSRNKFTNTSNGSGYRMNGEGFVVLESQFFQMNPKSSILLRIKTTSTDGLIFLAFKDNTFMSIQLEGGSIVYKVKMLFDIHHVLFNIGQRWIKYTNISLKYVF